MENNEVIVQIPYPKYRAMEAELESYRNKNEENQEKERESLIETIKQQVFENKTHGLVIASTNKQLNINSQIVFITIVAGENLLKKDKRKWNITHLL